MNVIGVQLVLLCFAFFMGYYLFLNWKKGDISNKAFVFWIVIWLIFSGLNLFPKVLEPLIKELFIVRVMDLAVIGSFMVLTYLTINNNIKIQKMEKNWEKLIRKLAIRNVSRKKSSNHRR